MKVGKLEIKLSNQLINRIIVVVCTATLIYSLAKIGIIYYDSFRNKSIMNDIQSIYYDQQQYKAKKLVDASFSDVLRVSILDEEKPSEGALNAIDKKEILQQYLPLLEINEDVVGWVKVPNTKVDYPVLQAADNEYYLDTTINHEKNRAGSIFMDFRNKGDGSDRHTIIYGHHMRDGTMFKSLVRYEDEEFFNNNSIIEFDTLFGRHKWQIFSVYVTGVDFDYIKTKFNTPDEYIKFLDAIKSKSMFSSEVELNENDQILTLSTCTYDYNNARFVVHAKKLP